MEGKRKRLVIGLVGQAKVGKSTVAQCLKVLRNFQEFSFADRLKHICSDVFNLDLCYFYNTQMKEEITDLGVTPRQLMETVGTDLFRTSLQKSLPSLKLNIDNVGDVSIWTSMLYRELQDEKLSGVDCVISDVRFEDEMRMIKELGGYLLFIERPSVNQVSVHQSNKVDELVRAFPDLIDGRITNDCSIIDLTTRVDDEIANLLRKKG